MLGTALPDAFVPGLVGATVDEDVAGLVGTDSVGLASGLLQA
jgi:hypothetical protein